MLRKILTCRRSVLALTGMVCCLTITLATGVDTSGSIALIVTSVAGANATQAIFSTKQPIPNGKESE